jgi:hypothetical protein
VNVDESIYAVDTFDYDVTAVMYIVPPFEAELERKLDEEMVKNI